MEPKEISAFLAPPKMTPFEILLEMTGAAIALLLVIAGNSFYLHDYRYGIDCFLVALVLGFVFFRKRKLVLVISSLSCILAFGCLGLPFHPSLPGFLLLLGCATALYFTVRWSYEKYPHLAESVIRGTQVSPL